MSITKTNSMVQKQFSTRNSMGEQASIDVVKAIEVLFLKKKTINMIFAAAPSQNEFLENFSKSGIDFSRINAFHMDEYIGLRKDAPQGFGNFLANGLFDKVNFKSVNYLNGNACDIQAECERYSELLKECPPDIVCLGIGENAHIAFNDPGEADFSDEKLVKVVYLDDVCRMQQVNDGCFADISEVPKSALSLTVPALVNAKHHFCVVPSATKAQAVRNMFHEKIDEKYPATILRTCENIIFYFDAASAELL